MTSKTHSEIARKYARDVVGGKIPAGGYIIKACQRHLNDLARSESGESRWFYDEKKANRACKFVELMPHTKGEWLTKRLKLTLEPWQCFLVASIFGWIDRITGLRKHRQAVLLVPRKNGKSQLAAAIGLYMLTADGEAGAEVYSGAVSRKQAMEVFTPAKVMVDKSPMLSDKFDLDSRAQSIIRTSDQSKFEPIIGNPGDGSSPHCAIVDEYHEHPDDRQVDTMLTGMGARRQPLLLVITTAGSNLSSPCYQMQLDCQSILDGVREDDSVFSLIYSIDKGDDWQDINNIIKANPNYGVSVNAEFLENQLLQAKQSPRKQSIFQTKHCNVWVGARDAFYNVQKWRDLGEDIDIKDFKGCRAFIGLDLASKVDIACVAVYIINSSGPNIAVVKNYLPSETVESDENYTGWANAGHINTTDGAIIDQNLIKDDILELCSLLDVAEVAIDPHMAVKITTELMDEGVPVVEVSPSMANFSEPMKQLDADIVSGNIAHNECPVMDWMISNVTTKENYKGQVYPRKERDQNKIDGVVALIMALGRSMLDNDDGNFDDWINNMVTA